MQLMRNRVLRDGLPLSENVLKVDSFLTHQVDTELMLEAAKEFANIFPGVNKIVTIEASGIAPATLAALHMGVPLVFAKKHRSITLIDELLTTTVHSFTKQEDATISISRKFLSQDDNILIIDDFLANGQAASGLIQLCKDAGAKVAGIGIIVEKSFQPGRQLLESQDIKVHSLVRVKALSKGKIELLDEYELEER